MNTTGAAAASTQPVSNQTYRGPFAIMTILFFMWGFITVWNDILIPNFKAAFTLTNFEAMLVQFAFFGAYGIGSLVYYMPKWGPMRAMIGGSEKDLQRIIWPELS